MQPSDIKVGRFWRHKVRTEGILILDITRNGVRFRRNPGLDTKWMSAADLLADWEPVDGPA